MKRVSKSDELRERLAIEMEHIKAGLTELKAKGRKLKLEARLDFDKRRGSLEKAQKDLKIKITEWSEAGEKAGAEMIQGLEAAARDLKKAVKSAASRLK